MDLEEEIMAAVRVQGSEKAGCSLEAMVDLLAYAMVSIWAYVVASR